MLTRLSSTVSAAILAAGTTVVLTPQVAGAGPCGRTSNGGACGINQHYHRPGGRSGNGGGHGKTTGPPCPVGPVQNCGAITGPAPVRQIPPADLAASARDRLAVPAPHIHTAPHPRSYVQIRTSLWVDRADYAAKSITVSAGGESVTLTASPQSVTWDTGERTVVCPGPGTPYGTGCGYTYQRSSAARPGGRYRISATVGWHLHWECTAGCQGGGDLDPLTMTSTAALAVGEVQTTTGN